MTEQTSGETIFERVALVGIGHIGSSLARALKREAGLIGHLAISDLDAGARAKALELGLADTIHEEPADAVADADLVVLCTPIGTYRAISKALAPHLKPGCVISDVGSVKRAPIRDMAPNLPDTAHFVPGHPIAGTEHSGPESGFAELFEGRYWLLTPPEGTDADAVARLRRLYEAIGALVEEMDADYHDKVLAVTSHVPHLIAYTIVGTAVDLEGHLQNDVIRFSAGGFRDFTRIAGSNPIMWRDIFLNNREAVLEILQRFTEDLTALQRAIRWGEGQTLQDLFTRTRAIRRGVIEARQEVPPSADNPG
ncbi:MAG: prephenate/arogenate dehydrogenase family protein [Alphaproteobacteria bacterium]|jgi:cyclohexadieny/prephenate dehydrogenase|nr:prephenate/arogenate dehydrogenase family protein [Alphaproteobacteria bacterium]